MKYFLVNSENKILEICENLLNATKVAAFLSRTQEDNVNTYLNKYAAPCAFSTLKEAKEFVEQNHLTNIRIFQKRLFRRPKEIPS